MKKYVALFIALVCVFSLFGCNAFHKPDDVDTSQVSGTYIVLESAKTYLLVAQIGEDGSVLETQQFSVPNIFYPSYEIAIGEKITINHNGICLETFPMQFGKIYSMEYYDGKTGKTITVTVDK